MNKSMWNAEAVKAYESGQGVMMVKEPHPHYVPIPQRTWVEIDDDDWIKALELCDFDKVAAFEFFEAALKAKNT